MNYISPFWLQWFKPKKRVLGSSVTNCLNDLYGSDNDVAAIDAQCSTQHVLKEWARRNESANKTLQNGEKDSGEN